MFLVVILVIYKFRHRITLSFLMKMMFKMESLLEWLPHSPVFRNCHPFTLRSEVAVSSILPIMNMQGIGERIKSGRSNWNELKANILAGVCLTISLYDIRPIYDLIHTKYAADFQAFNATTPFHALIHALKERFTKDTHMLHQITLQTLAPLLQTLVVTNNYTSKDIIHIISAMQEKMFISVYDIHTTKRQSIIQNNTPKTIHYFKSARVLPNQGKIKKLLNKSINTIYNVLSWNKQYEPQEEITAERYSFCKTFYQLSAKKVNIQGDWPNIQSKELGKLVLEEVYYLLESINFNTIAYTFAQLGLKIMTNRILMYVQSTHTQETLLAKWLIILYKISMEQFLSPNVKENRQIFYNNQLKNALKMQIQNNFQQRCKNIQIIKDVLREIYLQKAFAHAERQFAIKYYDERSEVPIGQMSKDRNSNQNLVRLLMEMNKSSLSQVQGQQQDTQ